MLFEYFYAKSIFSPFDIKLHFLVKGLLVFYRVIAFKLN